MAETRKRTGRPPTKPSVLRDGFYLEVRNKKSDDKGIMLRRDTRRDMNESARMYSKTKHVVVYGERKSEKWLSKPIVMTRETVLSEK